MSTCFTSRRNIERLHYLVLTDGRANGHLTLDLSGTRGMGFLTLRHETSSLQWHACICHLAFASLGIFRTAELVASNVLINIIDQMQASCEKYIAMLGARVRVWRRERRGFDVATSATTFDASSTTITFDASSTAAYS